MRRNQPAEAAMTALSRIARTAAARRAEVDALYRPCGSESIIARQLADVETWQAQEVAKVLAFVPGGASALARWVQDRAAERLAELNGEAADRRRRLADAEAERVRLARLRADEAGSPADALALLPRAVDVSSWVANSLAMIEAVTLQTEDERS